MFYKKIILNYAKQLSSKNAQTNSIIVYSYNRSSSQPDSKHHWDFKGNTHQKLPKTNLEDTASEV